jgi:hypothetical protein
VPVPVGKASDPRPHVVLPAAGQRRGASKIPTKSPQPARGTAIRPAGRSKAGRPAIGVLASGTGRAATRGGGEVIELEYGITVYPAREEHGRWRAVWHENGERQQCEAASEERLVPQIDTDGRVITVATYWPQPRASRTVLAR